MTNTNKTARRYFPTQAYLDTKTGNLSVVTPNGRTLAEQVVSVGDNRFTNEATLRETVRTLGFKARGKVRDYPYGILINV